MPFLFQLQWFSKLKPFEQLEGVELQKLILRKMCVDRESNPKLNLGKVTCYHYTIDAYLDTKSNNEDIYACV